MTSHTFGQEILYKTTLAEPIMLFSFSILFFDDDDCKSTERTKKCQKIMHAQTYM